MAHIAPSTSSGSSTSSPLPESPTRAGRWSITLLAALLCVALLASGCRLRLYSDPPAEPVPDAFELVRRTAVADVEAVTNQARAAVASGTLSEPVTAELERIAADSAKHYTALGGTYVSGVPDPDAELPAELPPEQVPTPTVEEMVTALSDAGARNRTLAATAPTGELARLLASIGTAQTVYAVRLAYLADLPRPQVPPPILPEVPSAEAAEELEPSPSPQPDGEPPAPIETVAPGDDERLVPQGLTVNDFVVLVASEDAARYALEVAAARADGELRDHLLARSRVHGTRAATWAQLGQIANTVQDPRQVAYALPEVADAAGLVVFIEDRLSVSYASLVAAAAPGTRSVLIDLLVDARLNREAWGAPLMSFPGMPELETGNDGLAG